MSGNPAGRPRGSRSLSDSLRRLLSDGDTADKMAQQVVEMALAGDLRAMEIILNRVEGPVRQAVDLTILRTQAEQLAAQYGLDPAELTAEAERILRGLGDG